MKGGRDERGETRISDEERGRRRRVKRSFAGALVTTGAETNASASSRVVAIAARVTLTRGTCNTRDTLHDASRRFEDTTCSYVDSRECRSSALQQTRGFATSTFAIRRLSSQKKNHVSDRERAERAKRVFSALPSRPDLRRSREKRRTQFPTLRTAWPLSRAPPPVDVARVQGGRSSADDGDFNERIFNERLF